MRALALAAVRWKTGDLPMTKRLLVAFVAVSLSACNGSKSTTAVRVVTENPGSKCTAGGVSIQSGIDADNDGTLDDDEVSADQTRVICNGTNGENGTNGTASDAGTNGLTALTRVTAEPDGANCAAGGSKIEVGLDADDDGTLSTEEVQSTSYVCNGTSGSAQKIIYGDVTIENDSDLGELAGVEVITGDLTIISATGGVLTLPSLKVVGGTIEVPGSGGELGLAGAAPSPLTAISLPNLERASALDIYNTDALVTFGAPKLARVDSIYISSNDALGTSLSFPLLADARRIQVSNNGYLSTISFAMLANGGDLTIRDNDVLAGLNMPLLSSAGFVNVYDNAMLAHCEAYRVLTNISGPLPYFNISGNDDTATCGAADICRSVTVAPFTTPLRHCFVQQSWTEALSTCTAIGTGASLLWFTSAAEVTAVHDAIVAGVLTESWIGYSDVAIDGTFVAANGNAFDPTALTGFWAVSEPNGVTVENYVYLDTEGLARDAAPAGPYAFICRAP